MPCSSPRNISASSSAVERASVFTRQDSTSFSPSKTPRTVLVLPTSMASSMSDLRGGRQAQVEAEVEHRRRVGELADAEEVDAGLGVRPGDGEGQPAGRLGLGAAARSARRPPAARSGPMLSSSRNVAPASSASATCATVSHSTCTSTSGKRSRTAAKRRPTPPAAIDVVVLDQRGVAEAHPLVVPAAAAHRVLLQRAQARGGLAGVQHGRPGALDLVDPAARVSVATPERWQARFSAVRSAGEQRPDRAPGGEHRLPGRDRGAVGDHHLDLDVPSPTTSSTAAATGDPGHHPGRRLTTSAVPARSNGTVATLVTSTPPHQVLLQRPQHQRHDLVRVEPAGQQRGPYPGDAGLMRPPRARSGCAGRPRRPGW